MYVQNEFLNFISHCARQILILFHQKFGTCWEKIIKKSKTLRFVPKIYILVKNEQIGMLPKNQLFFQKLGKILSYFSTPPHEQTFAFYFGRVYIQHI